MSNPVRTCFQAPNFVLSMPRLFRGYWDRKLVRSRARESPRYADRERLQNPILRGTARPPPELLVPPCIESIDQLSKQLSGQTWTRSLNSRMVCHSHLSPQTTYPAHQRPWCYKTAPSQTDPFHRGRQIRAHAQPMTRWGNSALAPFLIPNPAG